MCMKIINVPYIDQSIKYPTGCESVSSVMLLQYLGIDITVDEFIKEDLECQTFKETDGEIYGPDPCKYFCGSPYDEESFGCYAPVIVQALNKVFAARKRSEQYRVTDETGTPIETLLRRYIDQDMPVVFWACINMREPIIGPEWKLYDDGNIFTWISNEHCMLLVGYDDEGYYFNDPYENNGVIKYPKQLVEKRHAAQHGMAVGVCKIDSKISAL